ncbi:MAG: UDP-glucose 4-epimerase GalE [Firmicutes bacterium]|nr:UDP-glucose 4-epimerase GalE [Bacillota bacterium]
MKILVTGGTGYIGSHTVVELLEAGHEVVVIDNFSNSKPDVIDKIKEITGKSIIFYEGDVCDREIVEKIFQEHKIDAAIHFAGYKAVGESVKKPLMYYHNNLLSTIVLLEVMEQAGCRNFVFSSSATVYKESKIQPLQESFPLGTTNPYGTTKLMIEKILRDLYDANPEWSIALLRYFNPIGAHESGLIGENPNGIPNNLMPYIVKVATKELEILSVFGDDYDTPDGTGVRDYIHVVDLAKGHVKAINKITSEKGIDAYNLGTGTGYSVLDIVHAFEKANDMTLNYKIVERRPGDLPAYWGDPSYAYEKLGWKAEKTLEDMCRDSYRYAKNNK